MVGGEVRRLGRGSSRRWAVVTEEGSSHEADRVVLCQASGDTLVNTLVTSSVMMQGTYTGLQPLTRPWLPELDLWYTAQTVALLEVGKIFG